MPPVCSRDLCINIPENKIKWKVGEYFEMKFENIYNYLCLIKWRLVYKKLLGKEVKTHLKKWSKQGVS